MLFITVEALEDAEEFGVEFHLISLGQHVNVTAKRVSGDAFPVID